MALRDFTLEELQKEIERREIGVPEILKFKYYLNNGYSRSEIEEFIENQTGYAISDELVTRIINTFYEVGFDCVLNTITGELTTEVKIGSR